MVWVGVVAEEEGSFELDEIPLGNEVEVGVVAEEAVEGRGAFALVGVLDKFWFVWVELLDFDGVRETPIPPPPPSFSPTPPVEGPSLVVLLLSAVTPPPSTVD